MAEKETMEMENMEEAKTVAAKFKAERTQLKKAIQKAVKTIGSSRSENPVLSSIFMKLEGDELTIYSTDMKSAFSTDLEVKGDKDGYAVMPGRVLNDIIGAIPKSDESDLVEIEWDDNGMVNILAPGYKYQISAIQAEYSQYIMQIEDGVQFAISGALLSDLIGTVTPAIGTDEYRPNLMVARMEVEDETIRMIGTDSRRLVVIERKLEGVEQKVNAHIMGKGLKDLVGFIESDETITVTIDKEGKLASFVSGTTTIYIRMMETNYPEYEGIIPKESDITVDIEGKKLLEAIEGVMPMARNTNHIVHMNVTENGITMDSDGDEQGQATVKIETLNHEGGKLQIAFNGRYLQEAIKGVAHLTLRLFFNKKLSPLMIQQADSPVNFTWVIMPIRPS